MSSHALDANATTSIVQTHSLYTDNYCAVAAAVLFIHEALITIDRGVEYFWTANKRKGASLLFLTNKWFSVAFNILVLVGPALKSSDFMFLAGNSGACDGISAVYPWGSILCSLCGCFKQEQGPRIMHPHIVPSPGRCNFVVVASRVPLIVTDILLIYVTWTKLRSRPTLKKLRRQARRLTLSDILFRDGIVCFMVLFVLNTLNVILSVTALANSGEGSRITGFTNSLNAILVSRFLLELQEADRAVVRLDCDDPLHTSRSLWDDSPRFTISSFGGAANPDLREPRDSINEPSDDDLGRDGFERGEQSHTVGLPVSGASAGVSSEVAVTIA